MFFLFSTYLYPILFNNNSSVSRSFSPGHVEKHSRQLIYETNILNTFINFKNFLTIFNSSVNSDFNSNYDFHFNITFNSIFAIAECILALYTAFITVLTQLKNAFMDNFNQQKLWTIVTLLVCFRPFNFSRHIYSRFMVSMSSLICFIKGSPLPLNGFLLILVGFLKGFGDL